MRILAAALVSCLVVFGLSACSQSSSSNNDSNCTPDCSAKSCGDDGCGGECGTCDAASTCNGGVCAPLTCGNGELDDGETCDDSTGIPCATQAACEPLEGCFSATFSGAPESCDALCETTQIDECIDDDGCCPVACTPESDRDCVPDTCGDGVVQPPETCDEPDFPCPTQAQCQPTHSCDLATLRGEAFTCVVTCVHTEIVACLMLSDGCCPEQCTYQNDSDCPAPVCGNGVVEQGELCDTTAVGAEACPADCNDNRACTTDLLNGMDCTTSCSHATQGACTDADGCCPPACTPANDSDCNNVSCGDGVIDGDEGCDNAIAAGQPGACPATDADCDDGDPCTTDMQVGDAADCSARCVNAPLACAGGDGCCPFPCTANNDTECQDLALCETLCFRAINYCMGDNELWAATSDCMAACGDMATGRDGEDTTDSVYCRIQHLGDALDDPETHCGHAGVAPAEGCVDPL